MKLWFEMKLSETDVYLRHAKSFLEDKISLTSYRLKTNDETIKKNNEETSRWES